MSKSLWAIEEVVREHFGSPEEGAKRPKPTPSYDISGRILNLKDNPLDLDDDVPF
jgi:hypothetical protein